MGVQVPPRTHFLGHLPLILGGSPIGSCQSTALRHPRRCRRAVLLAPLLDRPERVSIEPPGRRAAAQPRPSATRSRWRSHWPRFGVSSSACGLGRPPSSRSRSRAVPPRHASRCEPKAPPRRVRLGVAIMAEPDACGHESLSGLRDDIMFQRRAPGDDGVRLDPAHAASRVRP